MVYLVVFWTNFKIRNENVEIMILFTGGRTCRTVTQRVGNMVTTHTECS